MDLTLIEETLRAVPDEALDRVLETPEEGWNEGHRFVDTAGCRCFGGVLDGSDGGVENIIRWTGTLNLPAFVAGLGIPSSYYGLVRQHGKAPVVRAIKALAGRIIAERHPTPEGAIFIHHPQEVAS